MKFAAALAVAGAVSSVEAFQLRPVSRGSVKATSPSTPLQGKIDEAEGAGVFGFPGFPTLNPYRFDSEDDPKFKQLRLQELKNGRLAMLGVTGAGVVQSGFTFPGVPAFADVGATFTPEEFGKLPFFGWIQILLFVTLLDRFIFKQDDPDEIAQGIYYNVPTDPEEYKALRNKELNNGRVAMVAFLALLTHAGTQKFPNWPYHAIPLVDGTPFPGLG
uniref:Plastid light harvesting protein n=1 Tax=Chromera velia CCMP2878 TaxID=1169474 RepID=A0A0G4GEW1_9ALVE|mmetsp:Transcript_37733/g.74196  ORF Transcript_37733/g.74196 Transcript_37733/m.74196 type:complete len:217 (+) Transcript_37733:102-752(+)|eukprot:Cvel_21579.t1-p1 / transcript=Cvel_21579.t1 / gene=Cvel_21579 / organism=Chromera_velia_CCMP2878 / gene_product=Fucoxanthin-chlorophyll a-c binding protein E,, putative / transcript_product=Fucoxanthin-chlorophyll a-c binding protein E,, putative / location=Cvel_scaffold2036:18063-20089(+) / protein_length=216 / sequence_SO=supercontig / SO=protein_coding / is_pseudo=false